MDENLLSNFWNQLFPLGKNLFVALSVALFSLRFRFFPLEEKTEKFLRSLALGIQLPLILWPLFPTLILRGRIDLPLWFYFPVIFSLGFSLYFFIPSSYRKAPLREFSLLALLGIFSVSWAPLNAPGFSSASYLLWGICAAVILLSSEGLWWQRVFVFPACLFISSLIGTLLPSLAPLLGILIFSFWLGSLFKETLLLFSFFPEGNKRFIPVLIAFCLSLSLSLAFG